MAAIETAMGEVASARTVVEKHKVTRTLFLETASVAPPGHTMQVAWDGVPGADAVELTSASVTIGPELALSNQQLPVTDRGDAGRDVSIASGKRLLALSLDGLKRVNDDGVETPLSSSANLGSEPRLVISAPDPSGQLTTLFALPAVGARGAFPAMYAGVSFSAGVLNLPQLDARTVRIQLMKNDAPDDWQSVGMKLSDALTASLGTPSTDLQLIGPDNAMLWAFPGEMPLDTAPAEVDVKIPLQTALNKALKAGQPLETALVLRGKEGSEAGVRFSRVIGALVRNFPGVIATVLAGDPVSLMLSGPPLAAEMPGAAIADLTVRYDGIRILPISDTAPAGEISGVIVAGEPVMRAFPPAGLGELPLARVGLIGRAPIECELSVQMVNFSSGTASPPGVIKLSPSVTFRTVWIDLPKMPPVQQPAALSVRANTGRFFWAAAEMPLLLFAVRDPDPGGRPLRLDGAEILSVAKEKTHLPGQTLPAGHFRGWAPILDSELFLTVELSDLQLRYSR
jgi:hypothetical protein